MMFVLKLFPSVLAREAYQAREFMVKAWERYFAAGGHERGSKLVQARAGINDDYGIPLTETARMEVLGAVAVLTNTLPATFWTVFHIFSDPAVLADVRAEVARGVGTAPDGATRTIDLAHVKSACPVLLSTFQEVFRVEGVAVSTRFALEDHLLDGKYLIRKGSTLLIPAGVLHTDPQHWGETVGRFDHRRFLRGNNNNNQAQGQGDRKRHNPMAWRGFGGGTTLCPGRHFATTEILLFAALMVLRFDVRPVAGDGAWVKPTTDNGSPASAIPSPDFDFDVELRLRDDGPWRVTFSGYDNDLQLTAEDISGEATQ